MARYYFNVRKGDRSFPDAEGMELAGIESAWAEAAGSISDMVKDVYPRSGNTGARLHTAIEVCDDGGPVLLLQVRFVALGAD